LGRLLLYCLGHRRQILRPTRCYTDANSNCDSDFNRNSYANGYCKCYSYTHAQIVANGTAWTIDQAASNTCSSPIAW
jgi:hypothetical protein